MKRQKKKAPSTTAPKQKVRKVKAAAVEERESPSDPGLVPDLWIRLATDDPGCGRMLRMTCRALCDIVKKVVMSDGSWRRWVIQHYTLSIFTAETLCRLGHNEELLKDAVDAGNYKSVAYIMREWPPYYYPHCFERAAQLGNLDVLHCFLGREREQRDCNVAVNAVKSKNLVYLRWLWDHGHRFKDVRVLRTAAATGHLPTVIWLVEEVGAEPDYTAIQAAIQEGHVNVMEYLHKRHPRTYVDPNVIGPPHALQWLAERDLWHPTLQAFTRAILTHSMATLRWLVASHGPAPVHRRLEAGSIVIADWTIEELEWITTTFGIEWDATDFKYGHALPAEKSAWILCHMKPSLAAWRMLVQVGDFALADELMSKNPGAWNSIGGRYGAAEALGRSDWAEWLGKRTLTSPS